MTAEDQDEYERFMSSPCPACGDPAGPCNFACEDPDCMSFDCESHDACVPETVEDYLLRHHRHFTSVTTLTPREVYL